MCASPGQLQCQTAPDLRGDCVLSLCRACRLQGRRGLLMLAVMSAGAEGCAWACGRPAGQDECAGGPEAAAWLGGAAAFL